MPWAECIDCGDEFFREYEERWKVRCVRCWRRNKHNKNDDAYEYLATLITLRDENQRLKEQVLALEEHLRFLIFAAHPDRNPGKEDQAKKATQFLLELWKH
jgi:DNA-directed RNA polymerase subunit RPC12/RpoP